MASLPNTEMMDFLRTMENSVQAQADEIGKKIARNYQSNPPVPYGKSINVLAIGALNYDAMERKSMALVRYGHFREQWPDVYPKGTNPQHDYMDDEFVSPAIIKYSLPEKPEEVIMGRTKYLIWFPLNDIFTSHTQFMQQTGKNGYPLPDVFIDEEDQWLCTLYNFSRGVIKYCSGLNKDTGGASGASSYA